MATEIAPLTLGEIRTISTADGGTALTTSETYTTFLQGTKWAAWYSRNHSASSVIIKVAKCPWLTIFKTADALATTVTDSSAAMQDADTSTLLTLDDFDVAGNNDFIYVGSYTPFAGVNVDVGNVNGTNSVLTVKYRKNDSTWADISDSDGTISSSKTLAQDGSVTWTIPTDWAATEKLADIESIGAAINVPFKNQVGMYWSRWEVSVQLDSAVTVLRMIAIPRSTAFVELVTTLGMADSLGQGTGGWSGIAHKTSAGTANLIINVASHQNTPAFPA
jgi:hypothetical protein